MTEDITFEALATRVEYVHNATSAYAKGAVNQLLTVRNWMIGYYIVEYEQNGKERSEYGSGLLKDLAGRLNIKGLEHNQLNLCRMFYLRYPQIFSTVSRKLSSIGFPEVLPKPAIDELPYREKDNAAIILRWVSFYAQGKERKWSNMHYPD